MAPRSSAIISGQVIKKAAQKLKRPKEKWYFNATSETFERFYYLLVHATHDYSRSKYFDLLLYGRNLEGIGEYYTKIDQDTTWREFQDEIDQKFGRIASDSDSTLATIDDNPGTGRLIDKFVYQPIGRSIERLFLIMELRYFKPPEECAFQIKRFLEESICSGDFSPDDEIYAPWLPELDFNFRLSERIVHNEACVSLLRGMSQNGMIAKAFKSLLMHASSKNRSLRVEAQKQIWSLFRYENMDLIFNAIIDLERLVWDGCTTTFQHCSPLDPDFQIHFGFVVRASCLDGNVLLDMDVPLGYIPMHDILETCARENRGFSSLPIILVIDSMKYAMLSYVLCEDGNDVCSLDMAKNLNLAMIAITGFRNEFSNALALDSHLQHQMQDMYYNTTLHGKPILPLWGKDRTEFDIIALELMVHFMIDLIISFPYEFSSDFHIEKELNYYIKLLNDADKSKGTLSKLEARASEDYLRKVTKMVQRGPISFAKLKHILTETLDWEIYDPPEHQTEATDESRSSTTWKYELCICADLSQKPFTLSFDSIPLSDNFGEQYIDSLLPYIEWGMTRRDFAGPVDSWLRIQNWKEELEENSVPLPRVRPGTWLYKVNEWWRSYDVDEGMSRIFQEARRPGHRARIIEEPATLPSPCQCGICKRSSHALDKGKDSNLQPSIEEHFLPHQTKDVSSQHRRQHNTATESSPLPSRYGRLKRKFGEEEPRPQIVPLPRRYRDNTADNTELRSLGPVRKKQRTSLSLESDTSDADAIITEVDEDSTESDAGSEDAMSVDEDFWSAKSKLSLLAIDD